MTSHGRQHRTRYITRPDGENTASEISRSRRGTDADWNYFTGRNDPAQRFQLRRLCDCSLCDKGKIDGKRCPECRGEGRLLQLVATAATPEAVGAALVQLGLEGEWDDCPVGILDVAGDKGRKWIVNPWLPSPRNVSDAGKVLQTARKGEK